MYGWEVPLHTHLSAVTIYVHVKSFFGDIMSVRSSGIMIKTDNLLPSRVDTPLQLDHEPGRNTTVGIDLDANASMRIFNPVDVTHLVDLAPVSHILLTLAVEIWVLLFSMQNYFAENRTQCRR